MHDLICIIFIFWFHIFGDFVLQSRRIANNKGKSIKVLVEHCVIYSLLLFIVSWKFAIINAILHFPVDFITSKLTSYFYKVKKDEYAFFTTIGVDQAVHFTILIVTYSWLKVG